LKYLRKGEVFLENDQTLHELIIQNVLDEDKTKIFNKKELSMEDNPKTIDTVWVCFNKP
jgi:hypothetical protein